METSTVFQMALGDLGAPSANPGDPIRSPTADAPSTIAAALPPNRLTSPESLQNKEDPIDVDSVALSNSVSDSDHTSVVPNSTFLGSKDINE
eukprot:11983573-Ditylum_brightwellii.AAC.1